MKRKHIHCQFTVIGVVTTVQKWNRSGFSRPDPTGKFQDHRRSTGFFTEGFVHCSMYLMKNFQKGGGMDEELKVVTLDGGLRKKRKKIFAFRNDSILRPFLVKFRFELPVLSSAKRAQNKHKKHWRAKAKLLDVLSNDILRKAKK